jgi:hypothetical protein
LIFSFVDTRILAIGIAQSYCWESPKPSEFGTAGQNWENIGWRVRVSFSRLDSQVRPKDHIDLLRPLLPDRYSPLQPNGNGLQSVYLTEVPRALAETLIGLIGREVEPIVVAATEVEPMPADDLDAWEGKLEQLVVTDGSIPETDRMAIVRARKGLNPKTAMAATSAFAAVVDAVRQVGKKLSLWTDALGGRHVGFGS